jgi:plastocyanin
MAGADRGRRVAGSVAVAILLAACSGADGGDGTPDATGTTSETDSPGAGTAITIESTASGFDPNTINVSGPTEVTITNNDSITHTFTLDDGSVSELIAGGETVTITVDVSETTGWVCNIHPSMTGTIEVT